MAVQILAATSHDVPGEICCCSTLCQVENTNVWDQDPLYAFKTHSDPNTMYMHQAMRQPDRDNFVTAMKEEIHSQVEGGVYSIIHESERPTEATLLPSVWQMRRKRNVVTGDIKRYKARLNIDGSRMTHMKDYDLTHAPVALWASVKLLLAMVLVNCWHTIQLDYVLAYPQAPIDRDLFMHIPKGFEVTGYGIYEDNAHEFILKIHKNLYGGKAAGRIWNQYFVKKLTKVGFTQSKIDECVFYCGKVIYVLYTDDSILAGPSEKEIHRIIQRLRDVKLNLTIEGTLTDFLGVNIDRRDDGTIHMSQPRLMIDQVIEDLRISAEDVAIKDVPMASSRVLTKHASSQPFDNSFHYRSAIGKLNYIEKGTRGDIAYATHQCARYSSNPKAEHGKAVRWLVRYLKGTRLLGTVFTPGESKGLEVFVDASFLQDWETIPTQLDHDMGMPSCMRDVR
jgi:hypothetical protein